MENVVQSTSTMLNSLFFILYFFFYWLFLFYVFIGGKIIYFFKIITILMTFFLRCYVGISQSTWLNDEIFPYTSLKGRKSSILKEFFQ